MNVNESYNELRQGIRYSRCLEETSPVIKASIEELVKQAYFSGAVAGQKYEREACAKIAEEMELVPPTNWGNGAKFNATKIKNAIRQREEV
jgi:hypothetical protein